MRRAEVLPFGPAAAAKLTADESCFADCLRLGDLVLLIYWFVEDGGPCRQVLYPNRRHVRSSGTTFDNQGQSDTLPYFVILIYAQYVAMPEMRCTVSPILNY